MSVIEIRTPRGPVKFTEARAAHLLDALRPIGGGVFLSDLSPLSARCVVDYVLARTKDKPATWRVEITPEPSGGSIVKRVRGKSPRSVVAGTGRKIGGAPRRAITVFGWESFPPGTRRPYPVGTSVPALHSSLKSWCRVRGINGKIRTSRLPNGEISVLREWDHPVVNQDGSGIVDDALKVRQPRSDWSELPSGETYVPPMPSPSDIARSKYRWDLLAPGQRTVHPVGTSINALHSSFRYWCGVRGIDGRIECRTLDDGRVEVSRGADGPPLAATKRSGPPLRDRTRYGWEKLKPGQRAYHPAGTLFASLHASFKSWTKARGINGKIRCRTLDDGRVEVLREWDRAPDIQASAAPTVDSMMADLQAMLDSQLLGAAPALKPEVSHEAVLEALLASEPVVMRRQSALAPAPVVQPPPRAPTPEAMRADLQALLDAYAAPAG